MRGFILIIPTPSTLPSWPKQVPKRPAKLAKAGAKHLIKLAQAGAKVPCRAGSRLACLFQIVPRICLPNILSWCILVCLIRTLARLAYHSEPIELGPYAGHKAST